VCVKRGRCALTASLLSINPSAVVAVGRRAAAAPSSSSSSSSLISWWRGMAGNGGSGPWDGAHRAAAPLRPTDWPARRRPYARPLGETLRRLNPLITPPLSARRTSRRTHRRRHRHRRRWRPSPLLDTKLCFLYRDRARMCASLARVYRRRVNHHTIPGRFISDVIY